MPDEEAEYALRRASEEAVMALQADHPAAAKIHRKLAVQYSARAVTLIADEPGIERPPPSPGSAARE